MDQNILTVGNLDIDKITQHPGFSVQHFVGPSKKGFYVDSSNEDISNKKMPNEDISKNKKTSIYQTKKRRKLIYRKEKEPNLT
jgi:hypothetical protein